MTEQRKIRQGMIVALIGGVAMITYLAIVAIVSGISVLGVLFVIFVGACLLPIASLIGFFWLRFLMRRFPPRADQ